MAYNKTISITVHKEWDFLTDSKKPLKNQISQSGWKPGKYFFIVYKKCDQHFCKQISSLMLPVGFSIPKKWEEREQEDKWALFGTFLLNYEKVIETGFPRLKNKPRNHWSLKRAR